MFVRVKEISDYEYLYLVSDQRVGDAAPLLRCLDHGVVEASIALIAGLRRQEMAHQLTDAMRKAQGRIQAGIGLPGVIRGRVSPSRR